MSVFPVLFESLKPTKINYSGHAKDLDWMPGGDFAIVTDGNDLVNINIRERNIEETLVIHGYKNSMSFGEFKVLSTDDGYYGCGKVLYREDGEYADLRIESPTKIAGMEPVSACSYGLISMNDGSLWIRRNSEGIPKKGKRVEGVEDVVFIKGNYAMTANGTLYVINAYEEPEKIADTGFVFDFEKSDKTYEFNIDDDFWKYGGFSQ